MTSRKEIPMYKKIQDQPRKEAEHRAAAEAECECQCKTPDPEPGPEEVEANDNMVRLGVYWDVNG